MKNKLWLSSLLIILGLALFLGGCGADFSSIDYNVNDYTINADTADNFPIQGLWTWYTFGAFYNQIQQHASDGGLVRIYVDAGSNRGLKTSVAVLSGMPLHWTPAGYMIFYCKDIAAKGSMYIQIQQLDSKITGADLLVPNP